MNTAANLLTPEARQSALRRQLIDKLEGIIRESVKPMERIEGIRIMHVEGLGGGSGGGGGPGQRRQRRRQRGELGAALPRPGAAHRPAAARDRRAGRRRRPGGEGAAGARRERNDQGLHLERDRRARRRRVGAVRDFNGLPQWTPFVAESRIEEGQPADRIGCVRNFRLRDGGVIRERLLTLSDYDYQCSYSILESPMGVENYVATLKLTPVTDGDRTFAEWWAEFDCAPEREQALAEQIGQGVFQAAFDSLKKVVDGRLDDPGPPVRRDRRADRARVGGAARFQQPLGLASRRRPLRDRARRGARPGRLRARASRSRTATTSASSCSRSPTAITSRPTASSTPRCRCGNYVATVQLKRVTDGERTFWHWESTFDVPRGREREFEQLVGGQVYEAGFTGLAAYLRRDGRPVLSAARRWTRRAWSPRPSAAPRCCRLRRWTRPPPKRGEVRLRQTAIGVNYIDVYVRSGALPHDRAAGADRHGGRRRRGREPCSPGFRPGDRVAYACTPPGAYATVRTLPAAQLVLLPDDVERGSGGRAHAEGHDGGVPAAPHAPGPARRRGAGARGGGRRRAAALPVGAGARRARRRHGVERGQGGARARQRLRASDRDPELRLRASRPEAGHRRPRRRRDLRWPRATRRRRRTWRRSPCAATG